MANSKSTKPNQLTQPRATAASAVESWQLEDAVGSYYEAIAELRRRLLANERGLADGYAGAAL